MQFLFKFCNCVMLDLLDFLCLFCSLGSFFQKIVVLHQQMFVF